jgi:tagaturonate reductase
VSARPPAPRLGAALRLHPRNDAPERVLQFGEGNFLRAFVDWMLHRMNAGGFFSGRAVLVQPIARGQADTLNAQDGLYTVMLRGLERGRRVETREIVSSVSRAIDPHRDFDAFLACARNPDLRFVVSNTTEAGIRTDPADRLDARPATSFPGKLTQLLAERCRHFGGDPSRGLVILPCELVEQNGDALLAAVLETAHAFDLSAAFVRWVHEACLFTNTLVDRIVTGYPADEVDALVGALGYQDDLLVAGEHFHQWVIETPSSIADELPLAAAGLNVVETRELRPYRERKVRILNGAHTMMALSGFLAGCDTVGECMDDARVRAHVERAVRDEIIPAIASPDGGFPEAELAQYAETVFERFRNPFIRHRLPSIALNSVSKVRVRIVDTLLDHARRFGRLPPHLTFAVAALCAHHRGNEVEDGALLGRRAGDAYRIEDTPAALAFFVAAWRACPPGAETPERCLALVRRLLAREDFWGQDLGRALPGLDAQAAVWLHEIVTRGMKATLDRLLETRAEPRRGPADTYGTRQERGDP